MASNARPDVTRQLVIGALAAVTTIAVLVWVLNRETGDEPRATITPVSDTPVPAAEFDEFGVYWVGESFDGAPLDGQYAPRDEGFRAPYIITYGSCGERFVAGCKPSLVIKTQPGCLTDPDPILKIRERPTRIERHLSVETGDTIVTIYATDAATERRVADQMVHANPQVRQGGVWEASQPLRGSLCEVVRVNPPPTRTPPPTETPDPTVDEEATQALPATVFASFGDFRSVDTLRQAQAELGWRIVTTYDPRYTLVNEGAIRQFRGGASRLEQTGYEVLGGPYPLQVHQEPATNEGFDVSPYAEREMVGPWGAEVWAHRAQHGIEFISGTTADGTPISVSVTGDRERYTMDQIRVFVATLEFLE